MENADLVTRDTALCFITLDGDPTAAASDAMIRRLVKSNASRARKEVAKVQHSAVLQSGTSIAVSRNDGSKGKSQFALSSRKPLKRTRRQAPPHNPTIDKRALVTYKSASPGPDLAIAPSVKIGYQRQYMQIPRSLAFQPQYSATWLSVTVRPQVETLIQQFFCQFIDFEPFSHDLVSLATRDDALFHSTLLVASLYYDTGANDMFHCQQALMHVSRRLSHTTLQSSDETIGAVGLLVLYDVLNGTREGCELHLNGLQQMVLSRGGLHRLPLRLRRTLSMIDTFHASTWDSSPRLPFMQPKERFSQILKTFPSLSKTDLHLLDLHERSNAKWSMRELLQVLRLLTSARPSDPMAVFNRLAFSDAIYLLEYQLMSFPDRSQPMQMAERDLKEAFRLAVFVYIDKVLRDMPSRNIGGLVTRLVSALESLLNRGDAKLLGYTHLKMVLWILVSGRLTAQDVDERRFFLTELVKVYGCLGIRGWDDFEKGLDEVGPALQVFRRECEEIQRDIEDLLEQEDAE